MLPGSHRLTLATEKTDNATVGSKAAGLERHPERRYKVSPMCSAPGASGNYQEPHGSSGSLLTYLSTQTHYQAAFEAYKEREMPRIRAERPGLRKQQYENELHDEFKKHPDNPFNQVSCSCSLSSLA